MKLFEFQAKEIFRKEGILVPDGRVAINASEAEKIAKELRGPVVLKAQVLLGGRGLAGGVKFADNPEEARMLAEELFGSKIRGEVVKKILVEKKVPIKDELYVSVVLGERSLLVIACSEGGVEIEAIAEKFPEKIVEKKIDIFKGFSVFEGRSIAKKIGLESSLFQPFIDILKTLYCIFENYDAELVEINPLVLTDDGKFIAIDAKMSIDDKAIFRHKDLVEKMQKDLVKPNTDSEIRELKAKEVGLSTYFELDGNIGIIADGAGTGMLTLDLVKDFEGKCASFCELGGVTSPNTIKNAMEIVLSNPKLKVLLMNFIGGLNRMDEMAEGIIEYMNQKEVSVPMVIRMTGTLEDVGREMLRKVGIRTYRDIYTAVKEAVALARRE